MIALQELLDDRRRQMVAKGMFTLIENLSDHEDVVSAEGVTAETGTPVKSHSMPGQISPDKDEISVICLGARGSLDDVAAAILAQLLTRRGIGARSMISADMAPESLSQLDMTGVSTAVLSYMNDNSVPHAKYLIRRLRRRAPAIRVIVALWSMPSDQLAKQKVMEETRADLVTVSLKDTLDQVASFAASNAA